MTSVSTGDLREKERKKEEDIINNNNNNNRANHSHQILKTFSVPDSMFSVFDSFMEIVRRENGRRGFSERIRQLIINDVKVHGRGNSQLKLANYLDDDEPSPNRQLCNYSRGHTNEGKVFCTNPQKVPSYDATTEHGLTGKWLSGIECYSCKLNKLRRRKK